MMHSLNNTPDYLPVQSQGHAQKISTVWRKLCLKSKFTTAPTKRLMAGVATLTAVMIFSLCCFHRPGNDTRRRMLCETCKQSPCAPTCELRKKEPATPPGSEEAKKDEPKADKPSNKLCSKCKGWCYVCDKTGIPENECENCWFNGCELEPCPRGCNPWANAVLEERHPGTDKVKCEECHGNYRPCDKCPRGELYKENRYRPLVEDSSVKCDKCRGTGEMCVPAVCQSCDGTKRMQRIKISRSGKTAEHTVPSWKCARCHATADPDRRDDEQCPKCGHADERVWVNEREWRRSYTSKEYELYKWWKCTRPENSTAYASARQVFVNFLVPRTYKAQAFIRIDDLGNGEGVRIDPWDEASQPLQPREKYGLVVPKGCKGVQVNLEDEKLTYSYHEEFSAGDRVFVQLPKWPKAKRGIVKERTTESSASSPEYTVVREYGPRSGELFKSKNGRPYRFSSKMLSPRHQTDVLKGQEKPKIVPLGKKCVFAKCDGGTWEDGTPPPFTTTYKCRHCAGTGELRHIVLSVTLGIGAKVTIL